MSLEDALNANTKAVLAHNALLEKMMASGGKAPAAPAAGTKPAAAAAGKPAARTNKPAQPTVATVTERITSFLKTGDKDTRDERKAQAKTIVDHYGVERFTAIDPASFPEALSFLTAYENGEVPDFGDDDGNGEEDDSGDMV